MTKRTVEELLAEAIGLQLSGRHLEAISLIEDDLGDYPDDPEARSKLALIYGGRVEAALEQKDRLGVPPTEDDLEEMERLLNRGIELDPHLGDLHWDRAVIATRFGGDPLTARSCLTQAKELGYWHPMMPRLEALIGEGGDDPDGRHDPPGPLAVLLDELLEQARGPAAGMLDNESGLGGVKTLGDYCESARHVIKSGEIGAEDFVTALRVAEGTGGDPGDFALDFMRRIAGSFDDPAIESMATNAHLRLLADGSLSVARQVDQDGDRALRKARRTARRGLSVVAEATCPIDADVRADLYLALGGTYGHHSDQDLPKAFTNYLEGLRLKVEAGDPAEAQRVRDLLSEMCRFQISQAGIARVIGGLGEEVETLRIAYEASKRISDPDLQADVGVAYGEALGQASDARSAVEILEEVLEMDNLSAEQRFYARFTLAARLSEVREPGWTQRAREIGEQQVLGLEQRTAYGVEPSTVWMNLGNYRRLCGDLAEARDAFRNAAELCPPLEQNEVGTKLGHIKVLLAETEILLGNGDEGERLLGEAGSLFENALGIEKIQFEALAATLLLKLDRPRDAAAHAVRGIAMRNFVLDHGPSLAAWENMLREWSRLDATAVRAYHEIGGEEALASALTVAEATKGRLVEFLLRYRGDDQAASRALDPAVHEAALDAVRQRAETSSGWVVSLFAMREGLSVVGVGPGGALHGAWLDDFDYDDLRLRVFEPLEDGIDETLRNGAPLVRGLSGAVVQLLLTSVGGWLHRALPQLSGGGDELVLLPHRLFRSMPLSHVEMPSGQRLSQLFDRVTICSSLLELGRAIQNVDGQESASPSTTDQHALVDPDGSLPFARIEGIAAIGPERVTYGTKVTGDAVEKALAKPGILLLSCHGDFDEKNPWLSTINTADRQLDLSGLLTGGQRVRTGMIVLGVCEAGRTRRSLNDEPLGFPTLLVKLGASLVLAPVWQVDDFASFLFITDYLKRVGEGEHPARALGMTSAWLRRLTAENAVTELEALGEESTQQSWDLNATSRDLVTSRIAEYRRWLLGQEMNSYPFDALDCCAFQLNGYQP